jgi:hypothetical protein
MKASFVVIHRCVYFSSNHCFKGEKHEFSSSLIANTWARKVPHSVAAIAQLGERLHGMQEVGGSIPPSSTKFYRYLEIVLSPHRLEA